MALPFIKEHHYKEYHCEPIRLPEPPHVQIVASSGLEHDLEDLTPPERERVFEEIAMLTLTDGYLE